MAKKTYETGFGSTPAKVKVDRKTCTLCGLCVEVCGSGLKIVEDTVVYDPDAPMGCMGCGQCVAICPSGSITVTGRRMSGDSRVPMPAARDIATPKQLEALLLKRRSVRIFSDKAVERKKVDDILQMASTAPMGIPPSDVGILVLSGRDKVAEFRDDIMDYYRALCESPARRAEAQVSDQMIAEFVRPTLDEYVEGKGSGVDPLFFNCPLLLVFHSDRFAYPDDPVIACTYAMIAAESLGLGTCMSGMIPFADGSSEIKRKYSIPEKNGLSLGLIVGYPRKKYKWALRRDFASVVRR